MQSEISSSTTRGRAAFLDRDGVVIETDVRNGKPYAVRSLSRVVLLPGVEDAVAQLRAGGFKVFLITNQPDIGNGLVQPEIVEAMHALLAERLRLDGVYCCPHSQNAACDCRKPRPGLLLRAAREHGIDLLSSVMVGDRAGDVEAGRRAGCRTVFIDRSYAEAAPADADARVAVLPAAVSWILERLRATAAAEGSGSGDEPA